MTNMMSLNKKSENRRSQFFKNIKKAVSQVKLSEEQKQNLSEEEAAYQTFKYQPDALSEEQRLAQFKEILASQNALFYECASEELAEKLEELLKQHSDENEILIGKNSDVEKFGLTKSETINFIEVESFEKNKENYNLTSALTTAFAAASETGTLFLSSGPENPTWLNYLAKCHFVLLDKSTLCQTYEQAFELGRKQQKTANQSFPPRSINMISGPSRTADIEQTLTLGAHGPIELIILIYSSKENASEN